MAGTRAGALKGHETRRANKAAAEALFQKRSSAARKGWETRVARERAEKKLPEVAPQYYEPSDYGYGFDTDDIYDVEEPMDSTGKSKR